MIREVSHVCSLFISGLLKRKYLIPSEAGAFLFHQEMTPFQKPLLPKALLTLGSNQKVTKGLFPPKKKGGKYKGVPMKITIQLSEIIQASIKVY